MLGAELVTYATHAQGKFNELVDNEYGIPVKVVGWGDKWISYTESKIKGVYAYVKTLPEDRIVVFVDGFDTEINGTLEEAVNRFKTFDTDILVSMDGLLTGTYITKKSFGSCQDTIANSGLYMGYAGALSRLLAQIIATNDPDDQRAMNTVCSTSTNIKIDRDNLVFANSVDETDAVFVGFPACAGCNSRDTLKRYTRDAWYYTCVMKCEFVAALALSFGIFYFNKNVKCRHLPAVTLSVFAVVFLLLKNIPGSFVL